MPSFNTQWVPQTESEWDEWVEIDSSLTGLIGATPIRGESIIFAGAGFARYIATITEADCFLTPVDPDDSCNPIPPDADPPFPPVYPYLFATDDIYGRDHLSLNLKMVRGDTYQFDAVIILNGEPVDLTAGTVRMTCKWSVADPDVDAIFQLSTATSGITVTDATAGEISVTIAHSLTSPLPAKKVELPYDIQFVNAAGSIYTVLYGTLTIVPDVTLTT